MEWANNSVKTAAKLLEELKEPLGHVKRIAKHNTQKAAASSAPSTPAPSAPSTPAPSVAAADAPALDSDADVDSDADTNHDAGPSAPLMLKRTRSSDSLGAAGEGKRQRLSTM